MKDEKFEYFILQTNEKLASMEAKIDQLLSFKMMLFGASVAVSSLVTLGINLVLIYVNK